MRIVEIRHSTVPISSEMRNAVISFASMDASIAAVITDVNRDGRPVIGFGFNSNGRYSAGGIVERRLIPRVLAAPPDSLLDDEQANFDPHRVWSAMMRDEKPGGHGERSVAVGVLDMAIHDLVAKIAGLPLHQWLADRRGLVANPRVFVYAAGGYYYPGRGISQLQHELEGYLDAGYTVVKMKIGGAPLSEDLRRIEAAIETVGDPSCLAVDANGRLGQAAAAAYGEALDQYGLRWFEEPGDPLDFDLLASVADSYRGALATGENLFSHQDVRNLLRYGGLRAERDYVQVDPALSYGLVEYQRILDVLGAFGWSPSRCIPHGGHQFALEVAAGLQLGGNEAYPGVFEPISGFADDAAVVDGSVAPSQLPGIGIEANRSLYATIQSLLS